MPLPFTQEDFLVHKICFTVNFPNSFIKNNVQKINVLLQNKQNI